MKESYWGYWLIVLGIFVILIMLLVQNVTATNTQDYYLAKEIAEASMIDAIDWGYYRTYGETRIVEEKFVESFVRRFAESANLNETYKIEFYEIYEVPPKVSIKISTKSASFNIVGDTTSFDIVNKIDMIYEADPSVIALGDPTITYEKNVKINNRTIIYDDDDGTYTIYTNTGQINSPDCNIRTARFEKGSADGISFTSFKCFPNSDNTCYVFMPQIYKNSGSIVGWQANGKTYRPGEKVSISGDTTFTAK